jgi:hypothetical protein
MTATIAAKALSRMRPATAVETARMQLAADLLADVRRIDEAIGQDKQRITTAMLGSSRTVTQVYGVRKRSKARARKKRSARSNDG